MSIHHQLRIIRRVDTLVAELRMKYRADSSADPELHRLAESLTKLENYLQHLDQLKPNYTTNEIESHMTAIYLNLDILKGEMEKEDYIKLQKAIKVLKVATKFHPTKYSPFEFIVLWFYELIYFV